MAEESSSTEISFLYFLVTFLLKMLYTTSAKNETAVVTPYYAHPLQNHEKASFQKVQQQRAQIKRFVVCIRETSRG